MKKFKYKFKTVKAIKERMEKKAKKELAVIELDIKTKKDQIIKLTAKLKEYKKEKTGQKIKKVNELHFYEKYESYLVEQIKLLEVGITEKEVERENKLKELIQKSKETKTFEMLEEKHLAEFISTQDKLEQKEMDEFAVKEFLKG